MNKLIINNLKSIETKFPNLNKEWKLKYDELILSSVSEKRGLKKLKDHGKYFNIHHTFPRSLGGNDKNYNLIKLTHQEHFISHRYLFLMFDGTEYSKAYCPMASAYLYMTVHNKIECPEEYARAKAAVSERMNNDSVWTKEVRKKQSDRMKGLTGENHPRFGKKVDINSDGYKKRIKRMSENPPMSKETIGKFNHIEYYFKSQLDAIQKTGIDGNVIGRCINGTFKSSDGWSFRSYDENCVYDKHLSTREYPKEHLDSIKVEKKIMKNKGLPIIYISPDMEYTFIPGISKVQEITGFGRKTIADRANLIGGDHLGHRFMWATKLEIEEERYIDSEIRVSISPNQKRKPQVKRKPVTRIMKRTKK